MGDTVLLCVHGIQGGPERFSEVERALAGRFDVVRLLLPGHGSDVRISNERHGCVAGMRG